MVIDEDIDLLSEILIRLPVKPLIRFKLVSKHWLSLISSPHFCRRSARWNSGFLLLYSSDIGFISLNGNPSVTPPPPPPPPPPFKSVIAREGIQRILQSCNGLLLCHNLARTKNYYIINPTTTQCIILPPLIDIARSPIVAINLAFDPLKSPYYKVVCVRSIDFGSDFDNSPLHCQIEIYSNESGIWRNSGDPFPVPNAGIVFVCLGVFSNGAIHWISPDGHWMYFNVEEERLEMMPPRLPFVVPWDKRRFRYFGESFGHLHLLDIADTQTTQFKVYELERDNSNWFLKFNVDLDPIVNARPNSYIKILSIVREEDDDESSLLLHPGEIISYKFKDKSFRKLHDLPPCSCNDGGVGLPRQRCINVYQYIETIACVRSCT